LSFDVNSQIFDPVGEMLGAIQQLGISIISDKRIVERIMHRWVKFRKESFELTWNAPDGTKVSDSEGNLFKLKAFVLNGYCEIDSAPISLSPATYRETQVAYGHVPDIFTGSTGEVLVFFTEREGEYPKGALGFSSDSGFGKVIFPAQKPFTSYDPDID
jgi:hypothetical protein